MAGPVGAFLGEGLAPRLLVVRVPEHLEQLSNTLGITLLGLFTHALFYSGFLEDPLTWLVIAITAAYSMEPVPRRRRREVAAV